MSRRFWRRPWILVHKVIRRTYWKPLRLARFSDKAPAHSRWDELAASAVQRWRGFRKKCVASAPEREWYLVRGRSIRQRIGAARSSVVARAAATGRYWDAARSSRGIRPLPRAFCGPRAHRGGSVMRQRLMNKWGRVASMTIGLLAAGLVAAAWAAPVNDVYLGLSKTAPQGLSYKPVDYGHPVADGQVPTLRPKYRLKACPQVVRPRRQPFGVGAAHSAVQLGPEDWHPGSEPRRGETMIPSVQAYEDCRRGTARLVQGDRAGSLSDFDQAPQLGPGLAVASVYENDAAARQAIGGHPGAVADHGGALRLAPPTPRLRSTLLRIGGPIRPGSLHAPRALGTRFTSTNPHLPPSHSRRPTHIESPPVAPAHP
jgi:hypothetical protein